MLFRPLFVIIFVFRKVNLCRKTTDAESSGEFSTCRLFACPAIAVRDGIPITQS